jgi:ectoine hydroxylase
MTMANMLLTDEQRREYDRRGLLVLDEAITEDELRALREAFDRDKRRDGEHRVVEDDGRSVRAVYAPHLRDDEFRRFAAHRLVLGAATDVVSSELYIYQYKVNTKRAFGGGAWAWHQDYIAWRIQDGLPRPDAVTVAVFLDEVDEFNGPMICIPGSHRRGEITPPSSGGGSDGHLDPSDIELGPEQVAELADRFGLEAPKGPPGTVMLFHPNIVHASAQNVSPRARDLALITYCAVDNQPTREVPRPEHLVGRSRTALTITESPVRR